ncbi:MAG: DMT family transporter [Methylobacteriaceae bacterium]|nr:DMT family transporter [Methylobacteriaceae bacterium]
MSARSARLAGALAPLALGLLWGFNWPAVKFMLLELPPWTARATGLLLSGPLLFALALARGDSVAVRRDDYGPLVAGALFTVAAMNILVAFAQIGAPTTRATIVTFTMPLWATVLAALILGERIDARRALGVALGAAGLAALAAPLLAADAFPPALWFALASGFCWGLGTVIAKGWPVRAAPIAVAAWQLTLGGLVAAIGMLVFEGPPTRLPTRPETWAALAYHVVLAQALAYALWFGIIARSTASAAAIGALLVPAVGFSSSLALLGERPTAGDVAGLVLIIAAAASVNWPGRRKPAA